MNILLFFSFWRNSSTICWVDRIDRGRRLSNATTN